MPDEIVSQRRFRTGRPPKIPDDDFVLLLLEGNSYSDIAREIGVSRQSVSERAKSDRIQALLKAQRWDIVEQCIALLDKAAPAAIQQLALIAAGKHPDAKPRDIIAAGKELLNRIPGLDERRTVTVQGEGTFTAAAAVQALSELDVERLRAMAEGAGLGPPDTGWRPDVIDAQEEE